MANRKKPAPDTGKPSKKKAAKGKSKATAAETPVPGARSLPHPPEPTAPPTPDEREAAFLVAGVGASAGGLEALGELFKHLRTDRMAFIVVQHLAPDHESLLTPLLARSARMAVVTAKDGMAIEPDHIYVTPPNVTLAVMHGVIRTLAPTTPHGTRLPVDYLFRSLAQDLGRSAVGVVLSGTGTDGTLGLKAIKEAGGFTFAQDPTTAKFDGMPRSALASGATDYSLPPTEIAAELARIAQRPGVRQVDRKTAVAKDQDLVGKLFVLIRAEFGTDLSQYKPTTIDRRIERRMTLHRIGGLEDYVRYVQQNHDELGALYKDLLITVTSFFRDPEAFEALKTEVFPHVIDQSAGRSVRVWVPACATGEEAYSIVMSLVEYCEEKGRNEPIQVFGTDLDDDAIQAARRGVYPLNIAIDVSVERLNRFFVKREEHYAISRRIRDMVVFSTQNILRDPPFSRMDLVSCRNLLIYLQPPAQRRVLRTLHYSLNPGGHLFLGATEATGDALGLFSAVDRKHKIYVKQPVATHPPPEVSLSPRSPMEPQRSPATVRPPPSLQALADRKVLELYGPPGVVVNEKLEVLQFRGRTAPYLDPAPGAASLDLLKVVRFDLHMELRNAIQKAIATRTRVTTEANYHEDGEPSVVMLDVTPLEEPQSQTATLLVLFHRLPPPPVVAGPADAAPGKPPEPALERVRELERELGMTKQYLQTLMDEKESTLEELTSSNEELQSANEELQSTNEELETSKEEMQSTNEELTTVNEELQNRMGELSQSNDDLHNVLAGVDNGVIIVGMDLKIRRYTVAAERLLHLAPGDIGRNIGFLDAFLGTPGIEQKATEAMQHLSTFSDEILAANRRWYALKITPYKTLDHAIRGALVTLLDIDVRKRAEEMTRDVGAYAERFLGALSHPLLIFDGKLRIVWANAPFLATFQLTPDETVGSVLTGLGIRQFADPGLRRRLTNVFGSAEILRNHRMRITHPNGDEREVLLGCSQIPASTETPLALLSIESLGSPAPLSS